jgi:N-methylhydantoinase B
VHVTNTSNLPVESLEAEYPLLVTEYALVEGSGGAGRHRGGLGLRRAIEVLDHEARFLGTTDRARISPWGLCGGGPGGRARLVLNPAGAGARELPGKVWGHLLHPGDRVTIETPGAGGYGPPAERPDALRQADARDGITWSGG